MTLSEAIRLGAMLHPQCFGQGRLYDNEGYVRATCAISAAQLAGFDTTDLDSETELDRTFPCPCPAENKCRRGPFVLSSIVRHLNDTHRWTRERIADYVETLERESHGPVDSRRSVDENIVSLFQPLRACKVSDV